MFKETIYGKERYQNSYANNNHSKTKRFFESRGVKPLSGGLGV
jgi:hypothetical protein